MQQRFGNPCVEYQGLDGVQELRPVDVTHHLQFCQQVVLGTGDPCERVVGAGDVEGTVGELLDIAPDARTFGGNDESVLIHIFQQLDAVGDEFIQMESLLFLAVPDLPDRGKEFETVEVRTDLPAGLQVVLSVDLLHPEVLHHVDAERAVDYVLGKDIDALHIQGHGREDVEHLWLVVEVAGCASEHLTVPVESDLQHLAQLFPVLVAVVPELGEDGCRIVIGSHPEARSVGAVPDGDGVVAELREKRIHPSLSG